MQAALKRGAKGGGKKPRPPYTAPDSLRSVATAKLLYAISEGEIVGPVHGERSVLLEGTAVRDDAGGQNFPGLVYEFRPGTVEQTYIQGFPDTSNEVGVGIELRYGTPYVRSLTNPDLSAVRVRLAWDRLVQQQGNGDTVGYTIAYAIDVSADGGAYETVVDTAVSGKSSSLYERSHRIDLPLGGCSWSLRVRRLTPNAGSLQISDAMRIVSVTEVIDAKLSYPHTALVALQYNSEQFQNIAKFSVVCRGRVISVPSNYDPEARTYSGLWDGTFKQAYSNNPAWVWYDLVLHPRYGLGTRINASMVNRWKLYQIAQYCDVLVPDGRGGEEPRYTCNLYIQSRKEAYVALGEIASIFHGASYWDGAQMVVNADMPADPVFAFTRAQMIDGAIEYKGTAGKDRHSTALVAWDDPSQNFKTLYEPRSLPLPGGEHRQIDMGAIGCTSPGQAQRAGDWVLHSERLEIRPATFRVGLDGFIPRPGDIVNVVDELLQGRANGGRIRAVKGSTITLDRDAGVKAGDCIIVNLPSGRSHKRLVSRVELDNTSQHAVQVVYCPGTFDEQPQPELAWAVDSDELAAMQFRVLSISRPQFSQFQLDLMQHAPGKYAAIDTGAMVESPPISVIPPGIQSPPSHVQISAFSFVEQTVAVTTMVITWQGVEHAVGYDVEWRRGSGDWVPLPRTGGTSIEVTGIYAGQYLARVRAVNAINVQSLPAMSMLTTLNGKTGRPPLPVNLRTESVIFAIRVRWNTPQGAQDTAFTELQYNTVASPEGATTLGQIAYPTQDYLHSGMAHGARLWFRARLVDRTGNIGAWSAWIDGLSSADASPILEAITGKITETQLGQNLLEKIDRAGEGNAQIEEIKETVNDVDKGLSAMWSVKLGITQDGKYYGAGMGMGIENTPDGMQSQVLFLADRFAIMHDINGVPVSPFVVQNGQSILNSAVIGKASITSAMIGESIESDDFVENTTGWRMSKSGVLQINGRGKSGARLTINETGVRLYYASGVLAGEFVIA